MPLKISTLIKFKMAELSPLLINKLELEKSFNFCVAHLPVKRDNW